MAKPENRATSGGTLFRPGQSGNPGGRPKVNKVVREMARKLTAKAIKALEDALDADKTYATKDDVVTVPDHSTRVYAAQVLLDRGWGKPVPETEIGDDETPEATTEMSDEELIKIAVEGRD